MLTIYQSQQFTCPGSSGHWASITPGSGSQLVSVGWQNGGMAINFWASQNFIQSNGTSFTQVQNSSLTSTDFWIWAILYTPDTADAKAAEPTVSDGKVE